MTALPSTSTEARTSSQFFEQITNKIFCKSEKKNPLPTQPDQAVPPFINQELKAAIFSFDKNKAPGPDNLDHYITRNLYKTQSTLLLDMYNSLLYLNYFPKQWKIGELVYFLKPNRPQNEADSYRPLSLLPTLGKVYEKMLLKRINYSISQSQQNKLNRAQHGFTEGCSTETALQDLMSQIEILSQGDSYISLISLDFQHTFDLLPWIATMDELEVIDIEKAYQNIIGSFLSIRGEYYNWLDMNGIHWFNRGCPQGSCMLWPIFVESLYEWPIMRTLIKRI